MKVCLPFLTIYSCSEEALGLKTKILLIFMLVFRLCDLEQVAQHPWTSLLRTVMKSKCNDTGKTFAFVLGFGESGCHCERGNTSVVLQGVLYTQHAAMSPGVTCRLEKPQGPLSQFFPHSHFSRWGRHWWALSSSI